MTADKIDASISLRSGDKFLVGRDRIRLLEAVAEHGNITRAAKALGFSYKTAWDAVNAINNLLPSPAFRTHTGGRAGGGAEVTPEGLRLIETFRRLEARLTAISEAIAKEGVDGQDEALLWMLGAQISTRNVFQCEVMQVTRGAVDVEVEMKASDRHVMRSTITNAAATALRLVPGRRVLALIKAPFVRLAQPDEHSDGASNFFLGETRTRTDGDANSEIALDVGGGKTITAVIPRVTADKLKIVEGSRLAATFDPSYVILAVN